MAGGAQGCLSTSQQIRKQRKGNSGSQLAVSLFIFYWNDVTMLRVGLQLNMATLSPTQPEVTQIQPVDNGLVVNKKGITKWSQYTFPP